MQEVDAITVSLLVENTIDMLSTRPAHIASELRVLLSADMQELTGEGALFGAPRLSLAVTARSPASRRMVRSAAPRPTIDLC
jgi:hypothetical protein